ETLVNEMLNARGEERSMTPPGSAGKVTVSPGCEEISGRLLPAPKAAALNAALREFSPLPPGRPGPPPPAVMKSTPAQCWRMDEPTKVAASVLVALRLKKALTLVGAPLRLSMWIGTLIPKILVLPAPLLVALI